MARRRRCGVDDPRSRGPTGKKRPNGTLLVLEDGPVNVCRRVSLPSAPVIDRLYPILSGRKNEVPSRFGPRVKYGV